MTPERAAVAASGAVTVKMNWWAETETWLPVPGYPGYEVSDAGRVRSLDRVVEVSGPRCYTKQLKGRILRPSPTTGHVCLSRRGKVSRAYVGALVREAFSVTG